MQLVGRDLRPRLAAMLAEWQSRHWAWFLGPSDHLIPRGEPGEVSQQMSGDPGVRAGPVRRHGKSVVEA